MFEDNYRVYGVRKMWKALNRQERLDEAGHPTGERYQPVPRCAVARRMRALGLRGATAGDHKRPRTTIPGKDARPEDALNRDFTAPAPDTRWVADITYVPTWVGFVYVAFVMDLYSRRVVGWRVSSTLRSDLALDALEQAMATPAGHALAGVVHHSDRGVQYLSIRYTERLAEAGITASVGSVGDSYDNAAAEALNRLFKTELIRRHGPWRTLEHVEFETLKWVDWYNRERRHHVRRQPAHRARDELLTPPRPPPRKHTRLSTEPGAVRFSAPRSNRRCTRSGIVCALASAMVVTGRHGAGVIPRISLSRISLATVLRETTSPASRRSPGIRGAVTPSEASWATLIFTNRSARRAARAPSSLPACRLAQA